MAHYVEARYDEQDNMFLPPLRTLGFNPQLKINDSLLAQSYIDAYDISYPDAMRRIEAEVVELWQHLDNEGIYELNDIGVLSVNNEGNLSFAPCEAGILTPELYGLSSFEMKPLDNNAVTTGEPEDNDNSDRAEEETKTIIVATDDNSPQNEEKTIVIRMSWLRNAVAAVAAIAAFILLTTPISNSTVQDKYVSSLNNPLLLGTTVKDTSQTPITIEQADTIAEPVSTLETENADSPEPQPEPHYVIVLASYVTKHNAQDFVERLAKKGLTEAEVIIYNKVTRVVYGNYPTEHDAYNTLRTLRQNEETSDAWVMRIDA